MARGKRQRGADSTSQAPQGGEDQRFSSPEAHEEYLRLLHRAVVKERGLLPAETDGELFAQIRDRGWETVCETAEAVPLSIVKEFYANAKAAKDGESMVRGKVVQYTEEAIRGVLNLSEQPDDEYDYAITKKEDVNLDEILREMTVPETRWTYRSGTTTPIHFPATAMNRYARVWNLFVCANLLPTTHQNEVTVERAIILYGIMSGQYMDLAALIHRSMIRFMSSAAPLAIPHASVVTRLCRAAEVTWDAEEPVQMSGNPLDGRVIARMADWPGGVADPRGLGYQVTAGHRAAAPPRQRVRVAPQHGRQGGESSELGETHYRRLARRMDAIDDRQSRFARDLTHALGLAFGASGVQIDWPEYGTGTVYPPPDSPVEGASDGDDE